MNTSNIYLAIILTFGISACSKKQVQSIEGDPCEDAHFNAIKARKYKIIDYFDADSIAMLSRPAIYRNLEPVLKHFTFPLNGQIVLAFCINRQGEVLDVAIVKSETTITDVKFIRAVYEVFHTYKFKKDENAPERECLEYKLMLNSSKTYSTRTISRSNKRTIFY